MGASGSAPVTVENAGCSGFSESFEFGFTDCWQGICLRTGSQIHVAPKRNGEYALDIKGIARP
jgi:hypothetical protein